MEPFVYTDIFDTKGIEYLIVIGFLLLIVPFWMFLNKPVKVKGVWRSASGALSPSMLRIPGGVFLNRNHTWVHLTRSGRAQVGMDDLLLHLTGEIGVEMVLAEGMRVEKGQTLARIRQQGKELELTSPITGKVLERQSSLEKDSQPLFTDPYGSWLYRIEPEKWKEETSQSYLASEARDWISSEISRFKDFLSMVLSHPGQKDAGLVLQEGGELLDFPLAELDDTVWKQFQSEFLELS